MLRRFSDPGPELVGADMAAGVGHLIGRFASAKQIARVVLGDSASDFGPLLLETDWEARLLPCKAGARL